MSGRVYRSIELELPLEDVMDYFENDPELPPEVENVDISRRTHHQHGPIDDSEQVRRRYRPL